MRTLIAIYQKLIPPSSRGIIMGITCTSVFILGVIYGYQRDSYWSHW